ncbi:MAG: transposase [Lacipirellulaceae bacterium]
MNLHWLLTWTTHGTWLPGDQRGFVGNAVDGHGVRRSNNHYGVPCDRDLPKLHRAIQSSLKEKPVWLKREQATRLLQQFQETATYRGWQLAAVAVMANHVHLIVGVAEAIDPEKLLGDFKAYGSRILNRSWGKRDWWTRSGSKRRKSDARAVATAVRYVARQERPLALWIAPEWREELGL